MTFIEEYEQIYTIDGIDYHPSSSCIHNTLLDLGYYSQLSFHSTKRTARHRAKRFQDIPDKQQQTIKGIMGKIVMKEIRRERFLI
ncbi:hypothetical protein [Candidatus Mycoplasma mahonii]|uniref:hypothetical protein n=1 Tax=Candidatus Mycoplasma mahonii TaxID=3004105 RepID=UPI0026F209EC|nr:hypothetical protein [Candidatus Mycoplasma mahonii]WKX02190.1 hypothetical protein O3I44_02185 [Candidatus Mycoplasma mahonii]